MSDKMNRRTFLGAASASVAGPGIAGAVRGAAGADDKRPNVLWIIAGHTAPKHGAELTRHREVPAAWIKQTDDKGQYPESPEGLPQVMYGWGGKCVNPEYASVRKKYGQITAVRRTKPKRPRRKKPGRAGAGRAPARN